MRLLVRACAFFLGVALSVPALAGSFEDGLESYQRGEYAAAFREWQPLADRDDSVGQFIRGAMCESGHGAAPDIVEAIRWYRQAADQGFAAAQHKMGIIFEKGNGVKQDYTEAAKWFRLAAMQGFVPAQWSLAILYKNGLGVPHDYVQAFIWFDLAENDDDRDEVAAFMTESQIADAAKQAKEMRLWRK